MSLNFSKGLSEFTFEFTSKSSYKSCPVCGGTDICTSKICSDAWNTFCNNPECDSPNMLGSTEEESITKWNMFASGENPDDISDLFNEFMNPPEDDLVNHPSHYTSGAHECIDIMETFLTPEEFQGFLKGNIFKYRWRADLKNGEEDIKKAEWYEEKLLEHRRKFGF